MGLYAGSDLGDPIALVLYADTGAGHRRAAEAVVEVLADSSPTPFRAVLLDPLTGPLAARPLQLIARLYGPAVRWAPWVWGAAYHISNSRLAMAVLWRTVFRFANQVVAAQVEATRPSVIVSCHPLTGRAAVLAARQTGSAPIRTVTVVTDLADMHTSWRYPLADSLTVSCAEAFAAALARGVPASRCRETGLPVGASAQAPPAPAARGALRRSLGLPERNFVVLLGGGGEGCGGLARRTSAIVRKLPDVHVVTCCGRNSRLIQRLTPVARRAGGRLTVLGFVDNFTDWLRCADIVVTKAGPGIIAEAACCGTPLLLSSHVPGQERGNAALVSEAGAGSRARGTRRMLRELAWLRDDPAELAARRAGCRKLARPDAAEQVARLVACQTLPQHRDSVSPR